jgi:hypothetical protein
MLMLSVLPVCAQEIVVCRCGDRFPGYFRGENNHLLDGEIRDFWKDDDQTVGQCLSCGPDDYLEKLEVGRSHEVHQYHFDDLVRVSPNGVLVGVHLQDKLASVAGRTSAMEKIRKIVQDAH